MNFKPLSLEEIKEFVRDIFSLLAKTDLLTPEELSIFQKSFTFYLLENNLQPFTENKNFFLKAIKHRISKWPKSTIEYPFLESELKVFFKPTPKKTWFKLISEYQLLVFITLLVTVVFGSLQIFISNK